MPSNYIGEEAPVNIGRFDISAYREATYEICSGMVALFSFGIIRYTPQVDTCAPIPKRKVRNLLSYSYFPGGRSARESPQVPEVTP